MNLFGVASRNGRQRTLAGLSRRRIKRLRFTAVARLASFRLPANPVKSLTLRPPNVRKGPNLEVTPSRPLQNWVLREVLRETARALKVGQERDRWLRVVASATI